MGKVGTSLIWKLMERFGVSVVQFVLQIILARILDPEDYGVLSIMIIIVNLSNVFIQNGFNTALIQNKDVNEEDYSSVFWVSLCISIFVYIILYLCAPLIAQFYKMPTLVNPFRVIILVLIPGAYNSVQLAKVSREMDFKKVFYSNIIGVIVSGIIGIIIAIMGGDLWALVAQSMLNIIIACIVMAFTVHWHPHLVCNFDRIKILFSFGWKLLVSSLIDNLYQDLQSLVIGRKYESSTLAFSNRGKQFPHFLINAINGAVQSVILPAMSSIQSEKDRVKVLMRQTITISAFVIFPMMAILAGAANQIIRVLLTDKWLPCVPYLQIFCFVYAFWPVHTCNLQTINALGRSDIFLKLEIVKKVYGIIALVIAIVFFNSPIAIVATSAITTVISCFVNAYPNKKLVDYSYNEQIKDILPSLLIAVVTFLIVLAINNLNIPSFVLLFVEGVIGSIVYLGLSFLFKVPAAKAVYGLISSKMRRLK